MTNKLRWIIRLFSLIFFFPILYPIKFCPYSLPWIACSSCSFGWCPGKTLRNPILCIIIILSITSGRAFCRNLCPYGSIQDITNGISRKVSSPDINLPYLWFLKYLFLVIIFIFCLDLEGKILLPTYYWAAFVLGIFLFLSSFSKRYWCRLLCPIGTIITFICRLGGKNYQI